MNYNSIIINLVIAVAIQIINYFFKDDIALGFQHGIDYYKASFLILVLLFWIYGVVRLKVIKKLSKNRELLWIVLCFFTLVSNILILISSISYFGFTISSVLFVLGIFVITILFIYEAFIPINLENSRNKSVKNKSKLSFFSNNIFLAVYSILGFTYIWNILVGDMKYSHENYGIFILEILASIFLFLIIGLPFRKYMIIEKMKANKTPRGQIFSYLSFMMMIFSAIYRFF